MYYWIGLKLYQVSPWSQEIPELWTDGIVLACLFGSWTRHCLPGQGRSERLEGAEVKGRR
jgi:hypothetical protein